MKILKILKPVLVVLPFAGAIMLAAAAFYTKRVTYNDIQNVQKKILQPVQELILDYRNVVIKQYIHISGKIRDFKFERNYLKDLKDWIKTKFHKEGKEIKEVKDNISVEPYLMRNFPEVEICASAKIDYNRAYTYTEKQFPGTRKKLHIEESKCTGGKVEKTLGIDAKKKAHDNLKVYAHGPRNLQTVALTFDSATITKNTQLHMDLIDRLVELNIPATFFFTGSFIENHPEIVRKVASVKFFEIGNHSYSHPDLRKKSTKKVKYELIHTQDLMLKHIGRKGVLFRAPFGAINRKVLTVALELGLKTIHWDVDPIDYNLKTGRDDIVRRVLKNTRNGSIVLFHMHGKRKITYNALPEIVRELRKKNYKFVTVSDLLGFKNPKNKENIYSLHK